MPVATFQGTVENGRVQLAGDIRLPEKARVYIVVPDFEPEAVVGRMDAAKFDLAEMLDMRGLRVMGLGSNNIAQAGADMPNVPFLMPDYGYVGGLSPAELTYRLPTGQPVFRAASYGPNGHALAREIRAHVGAARPAFVNAFVLLWGFHLSNLKQMLDDLGPNYVAVTPSQLNALYRQAGRKSAIKKSSLQ